MDVFTKEHRSEIMRSIRGKNTKPELIVRRLLHALGLRFRLHRGDMPGKPDVVMTKRRMAIFVHGCFWHHHSCKKGNRLPKTNMEYWERKISGNVRRDSEAASALRKLGWKVVKIWECETANPYRLEKRLRRLFGLQAA